MFGYFEEISLSFFLCSHIQFSCREETLKYTMYDFKLFKHDSTLADYNSLSFIFCNLLYYQWQNLTEMKIYKWLQKKDKYVIVAVNRLETFVIGRGRIYTSYPLRHNKLVKLPLWRPKSLICVWYTSNHNGTSYKINNTVLLAYTKLLIMSIRDTLNQGIFSLSVLKA